MKENPPYSNAEIQLLLSQYLDGELEPDRMVEVDALLESWPQYRQELLRLQAIRGSLQTSLDSALDPDSQQETADGPALHFNKISDQVWRNIAGQLQADSQSELLECDPEFISAYYDGEIPSTDPAFINFEAQLYRNDEASTLLADIGQVSEAVRQFGYRLEAACPVNLAAQVMMVYATEMEAASAQGSQSETVKQTAPDATSEVEDALVPELALTISAYADQELSAREVIEANRLIEADTEARQLLVFFNRLSEQIQSVGEQMQAQAPELWPQIHEELLKQLEDPNVVPLRKPSATRNVWRFAVPVAAAAVVMLFLMPAFRTSTGSVQPMNTAQGFSAPSLSVNQTELASVPMAGGGISDSMSTGLSDGSGAGLVPVANRRMMAPQAELNMNNVVPAQAPMLEDTSSSQLASGLSSDEASQSSESHGKTPSSEEYLFRALSEQMPDEDISTILGK